MARRDIFERELSLKNLPTKIKLTGRVEEEVLRKRRETITSRRRSLLTEEETSIVFDVQPNITESGSANYIELSDIRQAASLLIYKGSPSRTFSINATFVSRTYEEAEQTYEYVTILKSWRLPEKKSTSETSDSNFPSAPSRLRLSGLTNHFKDIPVRMIDLSIPLTNEIDYIVTPNGAVPIVWEISMTLKEAKSISDLNGFDIQLFRQGDLRGW